VFRTQVHHQEVISVHAAYGISHASMGCLATNTIKLEMTSCWWSCLFETCREYFNWKKLMRKRCVLLVFLMYVYQARFREGKKKIICTVTENWGHLTRQPPGLILICQNQSQKIKTVVWKCVITKGWNHKHQDS